MTLVWLYQISVRCRSAVLRSCGMPHFSLMPNTIDSAVRNDTTGGGVVLPASTVSIEVANTDPMSSELIARTLAT